MYRTQQNRGYLPADLIEEIHALSRPPISWDVEETISTIHNYHKSTYRSVRIATDADLSQFVGSVQWVCQSLYRPRHKRKNWFLDFSSCTEAKTEAFDPKQVRFETFRSSGKGGQNVNKVETGVRAIYLPTWQVTVCTEERSQYVNKQKALVHLQELVQGKNQQKLADARNDNWEWHTRLERGNPKIKIQG